MPGESKDTGVAEIAPCGGEPSRVRVILVPIRTCALEVEVREIRRVSPKEHQSRTQEKNGTEKRGQLRKESEWRGEKSASRSGVRNR